DAGCEIVSHSRQATLRLGERLGQLAAPGDLILLRGELGTGKTTLTQGIARGLGITGGVNSPTFTLIKEYAGRLPLYHMDLYRLDDFAAIEELGIEDYLERGGVSVVEWADRGEPLWPASWLRMTLRADGARSRRLTLSYAGARGRALCAGLCGAARADAPAI
ncbi:MAG TPA: tRNA (adenosine(37)-N6)-threonylcarbamoyltransferase complex ATPase subunit type 1 TsaE, partial [Ktedonobacterales bacterium]|nr:tRNA (adenosine(37)-N6)-threonylcarbamoyltransferase complex ATPase subunit type 1 TsaE [Ktedonobacterales bacterium]